MTKYSRRHGWMFLRSYASGDGSISFNWVRENDRTGTAVDEIVTESDVSMFLKEDQEDQNRWEHWDILDVAEGVRPQIRLVQNVSRPFHSSKQLMFGDKKYRYACDQRALESMGAGFLHSPEMTIFSEGRSSKHIVNSNIISALCFFLNNERFFCRRKAQQG